MTGSPPATPPSSPAGACARRARTERHVVTPGHDALHAPQNLDRDDQREKLPEGDLAAGLALARLPARRQERHDLPVAPVCSPHHLDR